MEGPLIARLVLVGVFMAAVDANPSLEEPAPANNLFDKLVEQIHGVISSATPDNYDTTCGKVCALLDSDTRVGGKPLKSFKPFCEEKCPDLLIEVKDLDKAQEGNPLSESTLANFLIAVLKRHDEL